VPGRRGWAVGARNVASELHSSSSTSAGKRRSNLSRRGAEALDQVGGEAVLFDGFEIGGRPVLIAVAHAVAECHRSGSCVGRSGRYPGGLALRFARVVRYRDDKSAEEADTDRDRALTGGRVGSQA
jgi:hypothetical protein